MCTYLYEYRKQIIRNDSVTLSRHAPGGVANQEVKKNWNFLQIKILWQMYLCMYVEHQ